MPRFDPAAVLRHYAGDRSPDQRTSMADARIAIAAAHGVNLDDLDPASGYNYSRRSYENVRRSWVNHIQYHGFSEFYDRPHLDKAFASWTEHRPDFTSGDDWLAAGTAEHHAYWGEIGLSCNRSSCSLHDDPEPTAVVDGQLVLDLTA